MVLQQDTLNNMGAQGDKWMGLSNNEKGEV